MTTTVVSSSAETAKDRLQAYLREHGVSFTMRYHPPAVTALQVAAREHVSGDQLAKPVVLVADGRTFMVVLPAPYVMEMHRLGRALGAGDVRLAQEVELAGIFVDCELGALPPFGSLYGLEVYADQTLTRDEHIEFRAGTHTDTLRIAYADFARLVRPKIVDVARHR